MAALIVGQEVAKSLKAECHLKSANHLMAFKVSKIEAWCNQFVSQLRFTWQLYSILINTGSMKTSNNIGGCRGFYPCLAKKSAEIVVINDLSWMTGFDVMAYPPSVLLEGPEHSLSKGWVR